jgi:hypothetical protein
MENPSEKPAKSAYSKAVDYLKETVHDAFYKPVMSDDSYVSHKINGSTRKLEQEMPLQSDAHDFNIGKIPRSVQSVRESVKAVFATDIKRPIYSPEFIEASLAYLLKNLKEGEKLQVVVYRVLSELFNGPKDVKNFLTTEEEIELIYRIAAQKFNRYGSTIEVVDLEKQPQHWDLFYVLRSCLDKESGIVDVEKAYGMMNPPGLRGLDCPSSLKIACCLYAATKKDVTFRNAILKGLPAKMNAEGEVCNENSGYYAMTEIAIRLCEIIAGKEVQAGVSRQHIYDDVVLRLIQGKKGTYRNVEALWPLFEKLDGRNIETIHINNIDNPVTHKKRRGNALKRLATGAASAAVLGLAVSGADYGISRYREKKHNEAVELEIREQVREQVRYDQYRSDYNIPMPPEYNEENVSHLAGEMLEQAHMRYKIPSALDADLKPLMLEYLLERRSELDVLFTNKYTTTNLVDLFIQKHKLFLTSKGFEQGRPFQNLMSYFDLMQKTLNGKDEFNVKEGDVTFDCPPQISGCPVDIGIIGLFRPTSSWSTFELAVLKKDKQKYFIARSLYNNEGSSFPMPPRPYTSEEGRWAASEFIKTQRAYDVVHLLPDEARMFRLIGADFTDDEYDYEVEATTRAFGGNREEQVYKDFMGEFEYRLIKTAAKKKKDGESGEYVDIFLARRPEESHYTLARAIEAAQLFKKARNVELNWQPPH